MAKKWIQKAIKRPGALHRDLGVPQGQRIPVSRIRAAAKRGGKTGARARLALSLRKMNPWEVEQEGDKYWVVKKGTGERVAGPFKSHEQALAKVKALYAAEGMENDMSQQAMMQGAPRGPDMGRGPMMGGPGY